MKQTKGMSNQGTGLADKDFVDLNGKTRPITMGMYPDTELVDNADNPSGFTATAMSKVSVEDWTNPIQMTKFSPKRKCD